ncbi:MAG TPA: MBL fold metallo-hydrolase [Gemmatimonadaceae bacterium]|nr:MBL fold metallo-hydrolase [Gemmatimonadaceae bacterium]
MFNRIPVAALIAGCFMIAWTPTSVDARNAPARSGVAARSASADTTVVVMLGVGMPRPDPDASGPATAVVVGSRVFLFDAGPGIMRRMAAAHLPINGPTALFITHLHSDHTLGLPDLIFTSWVMGRKNALEAYGPHGLQEMTTHILEAWKVDEDVRTNGLEHDPASGYAVNVHEISPGVVYDSGGVRISAIPVLHGSLREAYGYRIDTPTRSVVISGDTRPSDALVAASRDVDVLVHEVYSAARLAPEKRPGGDDWPRYMHEFHTSDVELGKIAAEAKPKLLVLTHIIRMGSSDADLIRAVRAGGFGGRIVVGRDLARY